MATIYYLILSEYKRRILENLDDKYSQLKLVKEIFKNDPEKIRGLDEKIEQTLREIRFNAVELVKIVYNYIYHELSESERNFFERELQNLEMRVNNKFTIQAHTSFLFNVESILTRIIKKRLALRYNVSENDILDPVGFENELNLINKRAFIRRGGIDVLILTLIIGLIVTLVKISQKFIKKKHEIKKLSNHKYNK